MASKSAASAASVASTLASLAEAAQRYANDPARMAFAVDRVAFRIREDEDLFKFCPSHADLAAGGGTIWGLVCESPPVIAGIMIRRLLTDRLGDEDVQLATRHCDAVEFALDEYPKNVGLYEVLARCPELRLAFARRPDGGLSHALAALSALREVILQAPRSRLETDRGCVGTTSAVYGVTDSDAYFVEADLFCRVLDVLSSLEVQGYVSRARGDDAIALRQICILATDLCDQLEGHPRAMVRTCSFLSSAVPVVFASDDSNTNADFWTLAHMVLTSRLGVFLGTVLEECGKTRMHDAADVSAVRDALYGAGRSSERYRLGRQVLGDFRLLLCHALLLQFHILELLHHVVDRPDRFVMQVLDMTRSNLLPRLRKALDSPLASRWPPVREACGALVTASERAPLPISEMQWLRGARSAFRTFAFTRFVPADGAFNSAVAEADLDPFGHSAAAVTQAPAYEQAAHAAAAELASAPVGRSLPYRGRCHSARAMPEIISQTARLELVTGRPDDSATCRDFAASDAESSTPRTPMRAPVVPPRPAPRPGRSPPSGSPNADSLRTAPACMSPKTQAQHVAEPVGAPLRQPEMKFFTLTESKQRAPCPPAAVERNASELVDRNLPQPLPFGGEGPPKQGLAKRALPPLASKRGFFYNTATMEYVA